MSTAVTNSGQRRTLSDRQHLQQSTQRGFARTAEHVSDVCSPFAQGAAASAVGSSKRRPPCCCAAPAPMSTAAQLQPMPARPRRPLEQRHPPQPRSNEGRARLEHAVRRATRACWLRWPAWTAPPPGHTLLSIARASQFPRFQFPEGHFLAAEKNHFQDS